MMMRRPLIILLLTMVLAGLGWAAGAAGLRSERPYEEGLVRTALRFRSSAFQAPEKLWSEHPPLAYLLLRGLNSVIGSDVRVLRLAWLLLFAAAFAGFCGIVARGDSSSGQPLWGSVARWGLIIGLFASPLVIVGAARLVPDTLLLLLMCAELDLVGRLMHRPSPGVAVGAGILAGLMVLAHAYGWVCALAMIATLSVTLFRRHGRGGLACAAMVAGGALAPVAITPSAFAARVGLLCNHYWSEPLFSQALPVPLIPVWFPLTDVSYSQSWLPLAGQVAAGLLLAWVTLSGQDPFSRWMAWTALLCPLIFWLVELATGGRVIVYHWLGWLGVLAACALARGLKPTASAVVSTLLVLFVVLPTLLFVLNGAGNGERAVTRAVASIREQARSGRPLVFGGARAFVLFVPWLEDPLVDRSFVFLRRQPRDSFVGKMLVPNERLIDANQWRAFPEEQAVVVQLEAAQQVVVPGGGWEVERRAHFVHNATAVVEIDVEARRRQPRETLSPVLSRRSEEPLSVGVVQYPPEVER